MKHSMSESINKLLQTEDNEINELHKILADSIREENLITEKLEKDSRQKPNLPEFLSDILTSFCGSWKFIISFALMMILWIVLNIYSLKNPFDPYPFILLNLVLSCIAAIQSPVILMSQNRLEEKDRQRSEHDYLINLKAELEIRTLHQKIDMLILNQTKTLIETQKEQIVLLRKLEEKLSHIKNH